MLKSIPCTTCQRYTSKTQTDPLLRQDHYCSPYLQNKVQTFWHIARKLRAWLLPTSRTSRALFPTPAPCSQDHFPVLKLVILCHALEPCKCWFLCWIFQTSKLTPHWNMSPLLQKLSLSKSSRISTLHLVHSLVAHHSTIQIVLYYNYIFLIQTPYESETVNYLLQERSFVLFILEAPALSTWPGV